MPFGTFIRHGRYEIRQRGKLFPPGLPAGDRWDTMGHLEWS